MFFVFYMVSLLFFFNFSSSFIFWFWLEFNTIIFLILITLGKTYLNDLSVYTQCLYYFLVQTISSIMFLFFSSQEKFLNSNFVLLFFIFFKLGVVPLHFWVYSLSKYMGFIPLFFLLNFQKLPMLFFVLSFNWKSICIFLIVNMIFGSIFLFKSKDLEELLVGSSICFFSWLMLMSVWNILGMLVFLSKYFVLNYFFTGMKESFLFYSRDSKFFFKILLTSLFLVGLPPLLYFYFKLYMMMFILENLPYIFFFLIWGFSFLCLVSYFNFFFFFFFLLEKVFMMQGLLLHF